MFKLWGLCILFCSIAFKMDVISEALNKCRTFETDFRCCPCQVHDHRCDDELHVFDWDEPCPTDYVIEEEGGFECVWFDRDFYYDYIFYDNEEASITEINCRRKCTNDEYYDKDTRLCARCHESCLNCNSSGIDGCISCKYEINDTCVTNCAGVVKESDNLNSTIKCDQITAKGSTTKQFGVSVAVIWVIIITIVIAAMVVAVICILRRRRSSLRRKTIKQPQPEQELGYTALSQDEHTTVGTREPYRQLEVDCTHTTKVNERVEYLTPIYKRSPPEDTHFDADHIEREYDEIEDDNDHQSIATDYSSDHYEPVEDPKEIAEKNRTDLKKGCTDMANMMQKESTIVDKKSNFVSDFKITEESQSKNADSIEKDETEHSVNIPQNAEGRNNRPEAAKGEDKHVHTITEAKCNKEGTIENKCNYSAFVEIGLIDGNTTNATEKDVIKPKIDDIDRLNTSNKEGNRPKPTARSRTKPEVPAKPKKISRDDKI
ncbi:uncharacterized protein LOC128206288 [Mya arenaria]|uniref:uncharacterized protein LOC128206288 n=1 Tax=Mya arenaria TaxID=6604 RepID=UPI0022E75E97|nr:uncharacterized protein LOC128206288 [Mya arenaria]